MTSRLRGYAAVLRKAVCYKSGLYPAVRQLPSALKIHEFHQLVGDRMPESGARVLDLGCGRGLQTQLLARRGATVVGVDPGARQIRAAQREVRWSRVRHHVQFLCGTAHDDRLQTGTFDRVFSFSVLEHIEDLEETLARLFALLRPGGELHATIDTLSNFGDPVLKERHRKMYSVQRYFDGPTAREMLLKAGFTLLHQSHILTSELAVRGLTRQLTDAAVPRPIRQIVREARALARAEQQSAPDSGLMMLCRARRA